MKELILEDVNYYSHSRNRFIHGSIQIRDGLIRKLEESEGSSGNYVIPGFVNTHSHVAMSRFRGHLDDMDLEQFLQKTFKMDSARSEEDIYHSSVAGIYEMLMNGITSFIDLYYSEDIIFRAVEDMGIRGFLSWVTLDRNMTTQKGDPLDNCESFIKEFNGKNSLISPSAGVQGVYAASHETIKSAGQIAKNHGTILHMHAAETRKEVYDFLDRTGMRPVQYLLDNGLIGSNTNAAHCVWITKEEVEKLGKAHVNVSWNSVSNQKLGVGGIPPVPELLEAGANVTIGTDSNGSNNSLNILETAKSGSIAVKNARWDASRIRAEDVFDMLTMNGGTACGVRGLGTISENAPADLLIIDREHYSMQPYGNDRIIRNIVYSMSPSAIDGIIIGGKWIRKNGKTDSEIEENFRKSSKWINQNFHSS